MTTRRERLEGKLERRQEWADKAKVRSAQQFEKVEAIASNIPLGQPILVGHHSEKRARRDAKRIHDGMSRGVEEARLAQHHESKASGLEAQLESSIFSDDDDAIEALRARIAEREAEADQHKKINAAWRKTKGTTEERVAALVATGLVSLAFAKTIDETMALCPWLKAPFDTTNTRASIRRDQARIEEDRAAPSSHLEG